MPVLHEYLWLVVVGAIVAFGFGYGTCANDVANAFGTSICWEQDPDFKAGSHLDVESILDASYESLALIQNNTVFTLGQHTVFPGADVCTDPSTTNLTRVGCKSPKLLPSFASARI